MNLYDSDYIEHDSSPLATLTLKFFKELEAAAEVEQEEGETDAA